MAWERDLIEEIRKGKFFIGSPRKNPLAAELHRALTNLSMELYQNDMHFIKEIVQNAEDNTYGENVHASLEFLLTNDDVAEMGSSATLLVLNNEIGLTRSDVDALCSVANSTKTGKRNKGCIGCKGIGFKSVFMVCKTPIIISNGFRIRFQDEASEEAGVGYIVPEWTESPTNEAILAACGHDKLPTTVMIFPLRHSKVDLVRKQLKEISPEIILFLSKIRELKVSDKSEDASGFRGFLKIARISVYEVATILKSGTRVVLSRVTLRVDRSDDSDIHSYFVFQGLFPVTHPIEEREEIHEWAISLAFPQEGRASSGHVGDVFSFLPTQLRTGFPFIINADFILTSSRESIRFDSTWNVGILDQIPYAFEAAFSIMLAGKNKYVSNHRDAYKFLPINPVENAYRYSPTASSVDHRQLRQKLHVQPHQAANLHELEKVRAKILELVGKKRLTLLSMAIGTSSSKRRFLVPAKFSLQIKPSFRAILMSAVKVNQPAPSVARLPDGSRSPAAKFSVVDEYIQENYAPGLAALGVPEMTSKQYESFLHDSDWLLHLPDNVYLQMLSFFAFEMKLLDQDSGDTFRLVKIRRKSGEVKLVSFSYLRGREIDLLYTSAVEDAAWIYAWVKEFSPWQSVKVIPSETSQGLIEANNSEELMMWIKKNSSLTELNVQKYAQQLIQKLAVANVKPKSKNQVKSRVKFSVLVLQFLYSGIHEKKLSREDIVQSLQSLRHVTIIDQKSSQERSASLKMREEGWVLLPQDVSKWPLLFTPSRDHFRHLIALSNQYLDPQCSLVEKIVNKSSRPDSMLEFIKQAFNAVDLPSIKLPANESFPLHYYSMTMEKSVLILQWLKVFLPNRGKTKSEHENDHLLTSLKALPWLKAFHHGWQSPKSVFFSISYFENYFTARDLPFLDVTVYDHLELTDNDTQFVFEELDVVSDMREGCATVAQYFSRLPAGELDHEMVNRFYTYLRDIGWCGDAQSIEVWVPSRSTSENPMWRDPAECILSDDHSIFEDNSDVTVLDKLYDASLLPFFSDVLHVPEAAAVDLYCEVWVKWSTDVKILYEVKEEDGYPQKHRSLSKVKAQNVLKRILQNWQEESTKEESSEKESTKEESTKEESIKVESTKEESSEEESSEEESRTEESSEEVWKTFYSKAWVPVAPTPNELVSETNETISIVQPSQVLWADNLELSKSFSAVANGKLDFVWLLPELSAEQLGRLVKLYSKLGVRKLSEVVTHDVCIPPNVWKKTVPRGKGLICEGLFRSVLAYLCKNGQKHDLSITDRQRILSRLISANEVVVSEPFEKRSKLHFKTLISPAIVTKNVLSYYDKVKGKLYYLTRDHAVLEGDIGKRIFSHLFAAGISIGILSDHPKLVQGLTMLLKLLCESGFAMKSVEYEFQVQNLFIFPEDEKLLMDTMAVKTEG